jgi:hypothetical protein
MDPDASGALAEGSSFAEDVDLMDSAAGAFVHGLEVRGRPFP